jgi:hypothetical protein
MVMHHAPEYVARRPMVMSNDRVHFTMPYETGTEVNIAARKAAMFAFNLSETEARRCMTESSRMICRPSQFARFLIKRNELGGRNNFKELNAELVMPPDHISVVDVSKRPAHHRDV